MHLLTPLLVAVALQPLPPSPVHSREPTASDVSSAFDAEATRAFVLRARAARLTIDSTLASYRATSYERMTIGGSVGGVGREKLLERRETVGTVTWSRTGGAHIEMKGRRREKTAGFAPPNPTGDLLAPVPWYPGMDALWLPSSRGPTGRAGRELDVDTTELVHPLARNSEAYYTFSLGDSATIALGNGQRIVLRELRTRPRKPRWNLSVGSYWFDVERMLLVRAIYRLSIPYEVWTEVDNAGENGPPWYIKALVQPLRGELQAVTIEHGLHDGRFWLPRVRRVDGFMQGGPVKASVTIEQGFRYSDVNSVPDMPSIPAANIALRAFLDSINDVRAALRRDGRTLRTLQDTIAWRRRVAANDSLQGQYQQRFNAQVARDCTTQGVRYQTGTRLGDILLTRVAIPCDSVALANAPELRGGLFAQRSEVYASTLDAATREALALDVQAAFAPQRITPHVGLEYARFNRVEGLSLGGALRQELGAGWNWETNARVSLADRQLNGAVIAKRSDGGGTITLSGYRRLVQADDYGDALAQFASIRNVVSGDDQAFYYRAAGAEVIRQRVGRGAGGRQSSVRLFGEWQAGVGTHATTSLSHLVDRTRTFDAAVIDSLPRAPGSAFGAQYHVRITRGADEEGWRASNVWRAELATGTRDYGRIASDVILGRALTGRWRSSVSLGGGTSVGTVPEHRLWNVGGWQTVRGHRGGSARGDQYWLSRAEVVWARRGWVQPDVFIDAGWAGSREASRQHRTMRRSIGGGFGVYELPIRVEAARSLGAGNAWSFAMYAPVRF